VAKSIIRNNVPNPIPTLIVNPGEVGTWLYGKSTLALVDLNKMEAEIIEL
jgi:hypothetical protein